MEASILLPLPSRLPNDAAIPFRHNPFPFICECTAPRLPLQKGENEFGWFIVFVC
jgi:hypothetical protein